MTDTERVKELPVIIFLQKLNKRVL